MLYNHCLEYLEQRIIRIQEEIALAQESANEESKSSMGDKYETSRSMAQLEVERNVFQLKQAEQLQQVLQSISISVTTELISPGSLVATTKGLFYIAISIGQVIVSAKEYYIISADSPVGKLLIGRRAGESFTWQNKEVKILNIS